MCTFKRAWHTQNCCYALWMIIFTDKSHFHPIFILIICYLMHYIKKWVIFVINTKYSVLQTLERWALIFPISSSTRVDIPLNLEGSGPIILTNWGTSRLERQQNLSKALKQRKTFSSDGLPCKNCKIAIVNSVYTSSKTCKEKNKKLENKI